MLTKYRKVSVPLLAIETSEPASTIRACLADEEKNRENKENVPCIMQWSISNGLEGLNGPGKTEAGKLAPNGFIESGNPAECLKLLKGASKDSIVFFHNLQDFLRGEDVRQALWFLRDSFKGQGSLLVGLCPSIQLPESLKNDFVVVSEPLPDQVQIEKIIADISTESGLKMGDKQRSKTVSNLLGLSSFAAEQAFSLSLSEKGSDLQSIIEYRRGFIGQTAGLEIRRDKITFSDIAGYDNVKSLISRKIRGKRPPTLILWLDEIEKAFAGVQGDTSGVSQDQLGTLLTWFQDRLNADSLSAMVSIGFPGTGKSAIAMASRNEAGCELVRMDMGDLKGSLVGESERKIRECLKVVDALSAGGHVLCIATCNSVKGIPSAFLSRFALGQYFFDLPTKEETEALLALKRSKYGIPETDLLTVDLSGWTGREINQLCFLANDLEMSLNEASSYIAPFCHSSKSEIEELRKQAEGKWISASKQGLYTSQQTTTGRKMAFKVKNN